MGASASSAAAVRGWTADDVAARVSALGAAFAKYAEVVKENGVDGKMLMSLEPGGLKEQVRSERHTEQEILRADGVVVEFGPAHRWP